MKLRFARLCVLTLLLIPTVFIAPALAVIKIDLPVAKRYAASDSVMIGKIAAIDPAHRLLVVTTSERLKDEKSPATFRLQFQPTIPTFDAAVVGQPVVMLAEEDSPSSVHVADSWLMASPKKGSNPPIWIVNQVDNNAAGKTFPGTTAALVRVLQELKAGSSTLLNSFDAKLFTGGAKEIAKLDVAKPTALLAVDVNGDDKADLIIATPTGVRLFVAGADGYSDATEKWGLKGATATVIAAGDVNGDDKIDLLLDGTLYLNNGQKFTLAPDAIKLDADTHILASTLTDLTGGKKADAGFVLTDGRLLVFKNPSPANGPWTKEVDRKPLPGGDAAQAALFGDFAGTGQSAALILQQKAITLFPINPTDPTADFARLTGDSLPKIRGFADGLKNPVVTKIAIKGDHRPDILITTDTAAMILINRGFGTYLPDPDAGAELTAALKTLPIPPSDIHARAAIAKAAAAPDDLLLLSDGGRLFLLGNPGGAK